MSYPTSIGLVLIFLLLGIKVISLIPSVIDIPMVRAFRDDPCGHHPDRRTVSMRLRTTANKQQKMEFVCNDGSSHIEKVIGESE